MQLLLPSKPLLTRLRFGAFLVYAPRGRGEVAEHAKTFVHLYLKQNRPTVKNETGAEMVARRLWELQDQSRVRSLFEHILQPTVVLVPVPRRAPLSDPDALWPAQRIAEAMASRGIGRAVAPILEREAAVPQSSKGYTAADRPRARTHLDSLRVRVGLPRGTDCVVLVDDVVTMGATLLAAASCLRHAHPDVDVKAFAVVRTLSEKTTLAAMLDPCRGTISLLHSEKTRRRP